MKKHLIILLILMAFAPLFIAASIDGGTAGCWGDSSSTFKSISAGEIGDSDDTGTACEEDGSDVAPTVKAIYSKIPNGDVVGSIDVTSMIEGPVYTNIIEYITSDGDEVPEFISDLLQERTTDVGFLLNFNFDGNTSENISKNLGKALIKAKKSGAGDNKFFKSLPKFKKKSATKEGIVVNRLGKSLFKAEALVAGDALVGEGTDEDVNFSLGSILLILVGDYEDVDADAMFEDLIDEGKDEDDEKSWLGETTTVEGKEYNLIDCTESDGDPIFGDDENLLFGKYDDNTILIGSESAVEDYALLDSGSSYVHSVADSEASTNMILDVDSRYSTIETSYSDELSDSVRDLLDDLGIFIEVPQTASYSIGIGLASDFGVGVNIYLDEVLAGSTHIGLTADFIDNLNFDTVTPTLGDMLGFCHENSLPSGDYTQCQDISDRNTCESFYLDEEGGDDHNCQWDADDGCYIDSDDCGD